MSVEFVTQDGIPFHVSASIGKQSKFVATLIDNDPDNVKVFLSEITGSVFAKVVQYLEKHETHAIEPLEKPLEAENLSDLVPVWDSLWIESLSWPELSQVILTAN